MKKKCDYDKCKCGKNPATHIQDFDSIISECGSHDKVLKTDIEATCKTCNEKFNFREDTNCDYHERIKKHNCQTALFRHNPCNAKS